MNTLKSKKEEIKEIINGIDAYDYSATTKEIMDLVDQVITQAKQERTEEIWMELEKAIVHVTEMPNGHTTLIEASNEFFKKMIDEDADRQKARNNFLVSIKKINNVKT